MEDQKQIYSHADAAQTLGVSKSTLWRWQRREDFPVQSKRAQVSNAVRYTREDVAKIAQWLQGVRP